jgi:hypothetical protein
MVLVALVGVMLTDRPVTSTNELDDVINVFVLTVLTTCKTFPPAAGAEETQEVPLDVNTFPAVLGDTPPVVVINVPVLAGTVTKLPVPDANCNTPLLSADWVNPLVVVAVIIDAIMTLPFYT